MWKSFCFKSLKYFKEIRILVIGDEEMLYIDIDIIKIIIQLKVYSIRLVRGRDFLIIIKLDLMKWRQRKKFR